MYGVSLSPGTERPYIHEGHTGIVVVPFSHDLQEVLQLLQEYGIVIGRFPGVTLLGSDP